MRHFTPLRSITRGRTGWAAAAPRRQADDTPAPYTRRATQAMKLRARRRPPRERDGATALDATKRQKSMACVLSSSSFIIFKFLMLLPRYRHYLSRKCHYDESRMLSIIAERPFLYLAFYDHAAD